MNSTLVSNLCLALLRAVSTVYNVLTFPLFLAIQKPWNRVNRNRVTRLDSNQWKRCEERALNHFIEECDSIPKLFERAVNQFRHKQCFGSRALLQEEDEKQSDGKVFRKVVLDDYHWFSYGQIETRVDHVARGLFSLGVRANNNVVIFAETRVEWALAAQALFRLGAPVVTLYATLGEEALIHGIEETEARVVITASDLLPRLEKVLERVSRVETIVFMEGLKPIERKALSRASLHSFSQVETKGSLAPPLSLPFPSGHATAVLMYTSGSTGTPKGVEISHVNLLTAVKAFFTISECLSERDVYCAYLPLAHVLEMSAELFFVSLGLSVGFATPTTLTDQSTGLKRGVRGDVSLLKPTVICCVPLVLDRIRKSVEQTLQQRSSLSRALFYFALEYKKVWIQRGFQTPLIDCLVFRKIRQLLGGRLRLLASGSAPLAPETHEFIRTVLNIELLQGYGLTETTASACLQNIGDLSVGSVGTPLKGLTLRLENWEEGNYRTTDKPNPRGEIIVGGDCITKGYFKNETLTKESYFEERGIRFFRTGDIGEVLADGSLRIIDRKKDLVKLQFGEYISPARVESLLKGCPLIDNICIVGDSRHSFVVAIVVPNLKALLNLAPNHEKEVPIGELVRDCRLVRQVIQEIERFGRRAGLHKTEIPPRVHLVAEEWLPDSGLVTAALKLRRRKIEDFYSREILEMYSKVSQNSQNL